MGLFLDDKYEMKIDVPLTSGLMCTYPDRLRLLISNATYKMMADAIRHSIYNNAALNSNNGLKMKSTCFEFLNMDAFQEPVDGAEPVFEKIENCRMVIDVDDGSFKFVMNYGDNNDTLETGSFATLDDLVYPG